MRIWTLHPRYLDARGLVAAWREALLAQKVLAGATAGYRNHPQLIRFRGQADPVAVISCYLAGLAAEAERRGYQFDSSKILASQVGGKLEESDGQLHYEWRHLLGKLAIRSRDTYAQYRDVKAVDPHPLFAIVPGDVRDWEKVRSDATSEI
ncbi:MAG: pyrimidine dimer DNA glycosylase/endonuclease V [Gallionella sp.]